VTFGDLLRASCAVSLRMLRHGVERGRGRLRAPRPVPAEVGDDGCQPAAQTELGDALGVIAGEGSVGSHEGILCQFLGVGGSVRRTQRDAIDEVLVMSQEFGERTIKVAGQLARAINAHADRNTPRPSSVAV
jgi:hypothetical protein